MSNLKKWVSTLRITTPAASAQTKVGNSSAVPLASVVIRPAMAMQAANSASVSMVDEAVIRRISSGLSNMAASGRSPRSLCRVP